MSEDAKRTTGEPDLGEDELGDAELDRDDTHAVRDVEEPRDADEAADVAEGHA